MDIDAFIEEGVTAAARLVPVRLGLLAFFSKLCVSTQNLHFLVVV